MFQGPNGDVGFTGIPGLRGPAGVLVRLVSLSGSEMNASVSSPVMHVLLFVSGILWSRWSGGNDRSGGEACK